MSSLPASPPSSTTPTGVANVLAAGWRECRAGLMNWRIAHLEGTLVMRRRYVRSRIGQFWLTLSTGASIALLGAVWTILWKQPAGEIFPYIAVSLVLWNFVSSLVTEGATLFAGHGHTLSNQGLAVSTYVYALLYKSTLVLLHDAVIILIVLVWFKGGVGLSALWLLAALPLTLLACFCLTYLTGMLCTRYRDMILFTATAMQLMFYITPVLWKRDFLPAEFSWVSHVNPFAAFLAILRDPLLGHAVPGETWAYTVLLTIALLVVTLWSAGKVGRRLIYWV